MPGGIGGDPPGKVFRLGGTGRSVQGVRRRTGKGVTVRSLRCGLAPEVQGFAAKNRKMLEILEKRHCGQCSSGIGAGRSRFRKSLRTKNCPVDRGNPPGNELRFGGTGLSVQGWGRRTGKGVTVRKIRCGCSGKVQGFRRFFVRSAEVPEKARNPLIIDAQKNAR